ncbi:MAG: hypothetical protein ACR2QM_08335 [Longimicrobiales bacterium]
MKYLRNALVFFFVVDVAIFVVAQVSPSTLVSLLPQFDMGGSGGEYARLVGVLFLALGLARLYGGLYIHERGAFVLSMWSWAVELIYTISELARGTFTTSENVLALVLAPGMLLWSLAYYRRTWATSPED